MSKSRNINDCNCKRFLRERPQIVNESQKNARKKKRQHYHSTYQGVVCKGANPEEPEAMLVPSKVYGYRTFPFSFSSGFTDGYVAAKPWDLYATCEGVQPLIHQAPNPYCTCGFYSLKEFMFQRCSIYSFGHIMLPSNFDKVASDNADQSFIFPLVSKISLGGKIIECEKGYRSEKIYPEEFMTIFDLEYLISFYEEGPVQERLRKYWWDFVIKQLMLLDKKIKDTPFLQGFQYTTYIISPETYLTREYWITDSLLTINAYSKLFKEDMVLQGDNTAPIIKPLSRELTDESFEILSKKKRGKRKMELWQR